MQNSYSSTKLPTVGSNVGPGSPNATWSNPSRITADDGSSASIGFSLGGQDGDDLVASDFEFQSLPDSAVIDGIEVYVDGTNSGCVGSIILDGITGTTPEDVIGTLNGSYGGSTDLWGATSVDPSEVSGISVIVRLADLSGGDGFATIDYLSVTIYWHIEIENTETDVPTRIAYKVYSRDNKYLGELPKVTSKLEFPQDINSAGSSIRVVCGKFVNNDVTVSPLLTEDGEVITTEDDLPILTTSTEITTALGNSPDDAIFKNSNRIKVWLFNKYYPNGKIVFSGQVNKVNIDYGSSDFTAELLVYSDGLDLGNYVTRGYPFVYTADQSQLTNTLSAAITQSGGRAEAWTRYGQSFKTGSGVTNIGAIDVKLSGTATVTLSLYDAVNGNLLGSATRNVSSGYATIIQFAFSSPIEVSQLTTYFFSLSVASGQSITEYHATGNPYANGAMYTSTYSGGSGGGSYVPTVDGTRDMYFKTYSGEPTTTTSYNSQDPTDGMAHGILLDYNARGGYITERDFDTTGLSLSYTFVVSSVLDSIRKILELCPSGYYFYVDLGTAEIDIKDTSETADFIIVRGRHIESLNLSLSIEEVKNYLLFTGGDTGGGTNLFRKYQDTESMSYYGIRTTPKSDNRVTLTPTADAIGTSFIQEESGETQQTTVTVLGKHFDLTQLTPGKTVGFRNFGNLIDSMVLQIARREVNFSDDFSVLTLGRLPVRINEEIQRINRELISEQTIDNPTSPS